MPILSPYRTVILTAPEDLEWAREVHAVPEWARFVILYGNEDSPQSIECYQHDNPRYDAKPELTITPNP